MDVASCTAAMSGLTVESALSESGDTNHAPKGLLSLPDELWAQICKYAVDEDGEIPIIHSGGGERRAAGSSTANAAATAVAQPPITRVCRRIRAEILPIYYADNVFTISNDRARAFMIYPAALDVAALAKWIGMMVEAGWWKHVKDCRIVAALEIYARAMVRGRLERALNEGTQSKGKEAVTVCLTGRREKIEEQDGDGDEGWTYFEVKIQAQN